MAVLFSLLLPAAAPAQEELPMEQEVLVSAVETVRPSPGLAEDRPAWDTKERPESLVVDEETWKLWKEEALTRTEAQPPDFIVPVDEDAGSGLAATLASFPGASWSYHSPSDTNLAKSGQRVLQVANSQIRLYDNAGNILHGRTLSDFYGAPEADFEPFDPHAVFDRLGPNQRFYVAAVQYDFGPPVSASLWLAVSRSANPANLDPASWCLYKINSLRNAGTANASWSDFPGLGVGADALLLTTNQHRFSNRIFSYAILRAINKATLSNNATACPTLTSRVYQPSTTLDNLNIFTIQPAVHSTAPTSFPGTANPAYAISAKGSAVGTTYTIFRVRNMTTANPTLTSLTINAASYYAYPPTWPPGGTPQRCVWATTVAHVN